MRNGCSIICIQAPCSPCSLNSALYHYADMEKSRPVVSSSSEESSDISLHNLLVAHGLGLAPDGSYVRWLKENPRHPRNWSKPRKFYDLIVIHLCDFFV